MTEVGAVDSDSDRWEEGGCTRANAMLLGVCGDGAVGRSRGQLSQLKKMWPSNAPTRRLPGATQPFALIWCQNEIVELQTHPSSSLQRLMLSVKSKGSPLGTDL